MSMTEFLTTYSVHSPIAKFMLDNGRMFVPDKLTFKGPRMTAGLCYMNSMHRALEDPSLSYVEGYVACYGVPIQHAWLARPDGGMIDPTLHNDDARLTDFFGVTFSTRYVRHCLKKNKYYGILDGYYNRHTIKRLIEGKAKWQL